LDRRLLRDAADHRLADEQALERAIKRTRKCSPSLRSIG
jgi:hypothetical protein